MAVLIQKSPCNARINGGNNTSTLRKKNFVNIDPGTLQENRLKSRIFAATWSQFDDHPSFGTLAFRNGLKYRNFDFSRLIGNHFSTL